MVCRHRIGALVAVYAKNFVGINQFFCGGYLLECYFVRVLGDSICCKLFLVRLMRLLAFVL
jgi:hypothetical protein